MLRPLIVTCKFRCKDTNYILINTKKINFFSANVCEIMLKIKNWQRNRCQFLKGCVLYNSFLLHPIEAFPAHVPCTVLGEAGVVRVGAAIPAGTHHGDGR